MKNLLRTLLLASVLALAGAASAAPSAPSGSSKASVLVIGGAMMSGDHFADSTLATMRLHYAGCHHVALVIHASHPAERDAMEAQLQKAFAHLGGIEAKSLHRFDAAGALDLLARADGIFVGGGETFVLLAELHRTGQLAVIQERVRAGVPYAGSSAGANVAGMLIGTTNDFPVAEIPTRTALGIFPATINPHHPEPATRADYEGRAAKIKHYLKFNRAETVLGLANRAMVRLHEGRVALTSGVAWIYRTDSARELKIGEAVPELGAAGK